MILGRDVVNPLTFPEPLIEGLRQKEGGTLHIQLGCYLSDCEQSTVNL